MGYLALVAIFFFSVTHYLFEKMVQGHLQTRRIELTPTLTRSDQVLRSSRYYYVLLCRVKKQQQAVVRCFVFCILLLSATFNVPGIPYSTTAISANLQKCTINTTGAHSTLYTCGNLRIPLPQPFAARNILRYEVCTIWTSLDTMVDP